MRHDKMVVLCDRGVVRVTGLDATSFLDNLVTNDLEGIAEGEARFTALLTPQGKILFDFFALRTADGFLLDVQRAQCADLTKRLSLYKLRAEVVIEDVPSAYAVAAAWGGDPPTVSPPSLVYADPRAVGLGWRLLLASGQPLPLSVGMDPTATAADYMAHRVALGIAEADSDFQSGDTFPHEAGMDRLNGVSFGKGCFVGQEVVARMQHKTVVRKRVVPVTTLEATLTPGSDVKAGDAVIGKIGSVAGRRGLAMLRLDRAIEAIDAGTAILAGGQPVTIDGASIDTFRAETARKEQEKANRV